MPVSLQMRLDARHDSRDILENDAFNGTPYDFVRTRRVRETRASRHLMREASCVLGLRLHAEKRDDESSTAGSRPRSERSSALRSPIPLPEESHPGKDRDRGGDRPEGKGRYRAQAWPDEQVRVEPASEQHHERGLVQGARVPLGGLGDLGHERPDEAQDRAQPEVRTQTPESDLARFQTGPSEASCKSRAAISSDGATQWPDNTNGERCLRYSI